MSRCRWSWNSKLCCVAVCLAVVIGQQSALLAIEPTRGTVLQANGVNNEIAPRFRLPDGDFSYELRPLGPVSQRMTVSLVTFPSPFQTPHAANNTVHCEYYRPITDRKSPGVIVLHILGGDFALARAFCNAMAQRGVAALFL